MDKSIWKTVKKHRNGFLAAGILFFLISAGFGVSDDNEQASAEKVSLPVSGNSLEKGIVTPASCGVGAGCWTDGKTGQEYCSSGTDYGHPEWGGACSYPYPYPTPYSYPYPYPYPYPTPYSYPYPTPYAYPYPYPTPYAYPYPYPTPYPYPYPYPTPPPPKQCADGIDNDGDGLVDLADPGCPSSSDDSEGSPPNPENFACTNDAHCASGLICFQGTCQNKAKCEDGRDNDGDGKIDLDDPGCFFSSDNDERDLLQPKFKETAP